MPIYEYQCCKCREVTEEIQKFSDPPLKKCPHCGGRSEIFAHGGARATADNFGVDFLGEIPLDLVIREETDLGRPPVVSHPDGPQAAAYMEVARAVVAKLDPNAGIARKPFPKIVFEN